MFLSLRHGSLVWLLAASLGAACAGDGDDSRERREGVSAPTPDAGLTSLNADNAENRADAGAGAPVVPVSSRGVCGDGALTADEACDDGNRNEGDGCAADCRGIEAGYACIMPGQPCRPIARCGDAIVAASEACDDGNTDPGDGCSERCKLETGFKCDGEPSACSATTCGDATREGSEGCDDGNQQPFDGCSATCQAEPDCGDGACSSTCGDGLLLGEECDDGNRRGGDGCSEQCTVEDGFVCEAQMPCEMRDGRCILRVPVVYRDFNQSHSDFAIGCGELTEGLVEPMLSSEGKPVLANSGGPACIQSPESFAQWYTDNGDNGTVVSELTLFDNEAGGFVNRFGDDGEPWMGPDGTLYDGNPLFFPIDQASGALDDTRFPGKIPAEYGYDGWPWEDSVFPGAPDHNFHFTTEVVYWFRYEADTSAVLDFTGDDDVWVFVNRRLAVDLGGPHVPSDGSVTVDAATAGSFGLSPGNVYEVRVFHAERKIDGSSFKLTLSGFDTSPSDCVPICGDGIVTLGEECDDGENDGGYEQCEPGCVLGPRCGDGVVQDGEDCDDGNRRDGDGCGSACRELIVE